MLRSVMRSTTQVCQICNLMYKISGDISQINSMYLFSVKWIEPPANIPGTASPIPKGTMHSFMHVGAMNGLFIWCLSNRGGGRAINIQKQNIRHLSSA
jgi:hypothetical protein